MCQPQSVLGNYQHTRGEWGWVKEWQLKCQWPTTTHQQPLLRWSSFCSRNRRGWGMFQKMTVEFIVEHVDCAQNPTKWSPYAKCEYFIIPLQFDGRRRRVKCWTMNSVGLHGHILTVVQNDPLWRLSSSTTSQWVELGLYYEHILKFGRITISKLRNMSAPLHVTMFGHVMEWSGELGVIKSWVGLPVMHNWTIRRKSTIWLHWPGMRRIQIIELEIVFVHNIYLSLEKKRVGIRITIS